MLMVVMAVVVATVVVVAVAVVVATARISCPVFCPVSCLAFSGWAIKKTTEDHRKADVPFFFWGLIGLVFARLMVRFRLIVPVRPTGLVVIVVAVAVIILSHL